VDRRCGRDVVVDDGATGVGLSDPSTGSMIISAVVGLFATAALAVKTYWYKLRSLTPR
jgi:hypothetical protein